MFSKTSTRTFVWFFVNILTYYILRYLIFLRPLIRSRVVQFFFSEKTYFPLCVRNLFWVTILYKYQEEDFVLITITEKEFENTREILKTMKLTESLKMHKLHKLSSHTKKIILSVEIYSIKNTNMTIYRKNLPLLWIKWPNINII